MLTMICCCLPEQNDFYKSMDGVTKEIFDWEGSFEFFFSNLTCKITAPHLFYNARLVDT
jgi:hypothetical protein